MDDEDYRPDWEEDEELGREEEEEEGGRRKPKKRARRSHTPEPDGDFDWKSHHKEMKKSVLEPVPGIAHPPFRIAAFNIQVFGGTKMRKKDVSGVLVKILQRYDLILIQEIRDKSETALDGLVKMVSQVDPDDPYAFVVSERLGRTNSKEQYAFMFRKSRISVVDTYQFDDGEDNGKDLFQREPFAVKFYSPYLSLPEFGIIAIHTQPSNAVKEVDALVKVYEALKKKWRLSDIIIAGDFNADEGYIDREDWSKIALRNDRRFKWMIDDEVDTTVGNTDRAYDRFVVAGRNLTKAVVPGSSKAYKFDQELGLSTEEAEEVSDHYPIEIELMGKVNHELQSQMSTRVSVTIKQETPIANEDVIHRIHKTSSSSRRSAYFSLEATFDDNRQLCCITATKRGVSNVLETLTEFQAAFPGVVFNDTLEMVHAYMVSSVLAKKPVVYGLAAGGRGDGEGEYDVDIEVKARNELHCSVTISLPMS